MHTTNANTEFMAVVKNGVHSRFFGLFTGPELKVQVAFRIRETSGHQLKAKRGA